MHCCTVSVDFWTIVISVTADETLWVSCLFSEPFFWGCRMWESRITKLFPSTSGCKMPNHTSRVFSPVNIFFFFSTCIPFLCSSASLCVHSYCTAVNCPSLLSSTRRMKWRGKQRQSAASTRGRFELLQIKLLLRPLTMTSLSENFNSNAKIQFIA